MSILTLWVLYAEDFKIGLTNVNVDNIFSWIAFFCLIFFLIEWILSTWSIQNYLFSFFFWLDLIAAASLIALSP